jgi:hypothetical protein
MAIKRYENKLKKNSEESDFYRKSCQLLNVKMRLLWLDRRGWFFGDAERKEELMENGGGIKKEGMAGEGFEQVAQGRSWQVGDCQEIAWGNDHEFEMDCR